MEDIFFLAHFTNTGLPELFKWNLSRLRTNFDISFGLYQKLNPDKFSKAEE